MAIVAESDNNLVFGNNSDFEVPSSQLSDTCVINIIRELKRKKRKGKIERQLVINAAKEDGINMEALDYNLERLINQNYVTVIKNNKSLFYDLNSSMITRDFDTEIEETKDGKDKQTKDEGINIISLSNDLSDLKKFVCEELERFSVMKDPSNQNPKNFESSSLYEQMQKEILFLREEICSKNKIINIILDDRKAVNSLMRDGKDFPYKPVDVNNVRNEFKNTDYNSNTFIKPKKPSQRNKSYNNKTLTTLNLRSIPINNRFESLYITDDTTDDNDNHLNDRKSELNNRKRDNGNRKNTRARKRTTVILGDSMVSRVEGWRIGKKLRNQKVIVKSFSGATIDDMKDYINPSIKRKPDNIILHCGTNNLSKGKSVEDTANEIIDLALSIKTSENEVVISSIISRADNDDYNKKLSSINNILLRLCKKNDLFYIDNRNIDRTSHLNNSNLHLNKQGTAILATNFMNAINY